MTPFVPARSPRPLRRSGWGLSLAVTVGILPLFGCARLEPRDPATEVSVCVDPARTAGIAPLQRTEGGWIGASASQVVHLRGLPDERRDNLWLYHSSPSPGALEVLRFAGARVVSVSVLPAADPTPLCSSASNPT